MLFITGKALFSLITRKQRTLRERYWHLITEIKMREVSESSHRPGLRPGRISWQGPGAAPTHFHILRHPDKGSNERATIQSWIYNFQASSGDFKQIRFSALTILQTPEPRHLVTWNVPNVNFWIFDISRFLTVFMCDFYGFGSNRLSGASGAGN